MRAVKVQLHPGYSSVIHGFVEMQVIVSCICSVFNKVVGFDYADNFITSTVCVVNMPLEYILAHAEAEGHSQVAISGKWGVECSEV